MQYIPCNSGLIAQETLFLTQRGTFLPKDLQKGRKSRQILICTKIAYVQAWNFRRSPNFLADATRAPVQLLPPCSFIVHITIKPITVSHNPNSKTQILDHHHSLASSPSTAGEVQPQVWACLCCRDQQVGLLFSTFFSMIVSIVSLKFRMCFPQ